MTQYHSYRHAPGYQLPTPSVISNSMILSTSQVSSHVGTFADFLIYIFENISTSASSYCCMRYPALSTAPTLIIFCRGQLSDQRRGRAELLLPFTCAESLAPQPFFDCPSPNQPIRGFEQCDLPETRDQQRDLMRIPTLIIKRTLIPYILGIDVLHQVQSHDLWVVECTLMLIRLFSEPRAFYHIFSKHDAALWKLINAVFGYIE